MCDYTRGGRIAPNEISRCGPKIWKACTLRKAKGYIVRTFKKYNPKGTNGLTKPQWAAFVKVMNRINKRPCALVSFPGDKKKGCNSTFHLNITADATVKNGTVTIRSLKGGENHTSEVKRFVKSIILKDSEEQKLRLTKLRNKLMNRLKNCGTSMRCTKSTLHQMHLHKCMFHMTVSQWNSFRMHWIKLTLKKIAHKKHLALMAYRRRLDKLRRYYMMRLKRCGASMSCTKRYLHKMKVRKVFWMYKTHQWTSFYKRWVSICQRKIDYIRTQRIIAHKRRLTKLRIKYTAMLKVCGTNMRKVKWILRKMHILKVFHYFSRRSWTRFYNHWIRVTQLKIKQAEQLRIKKHRA